MSTKVLFLLFCLILPLGLFAQSQITARNPYPVVDAASKNYFNQGSEILTVKIKGKKVFIQRFNSDKNDLPKLGIHIMPDGFSLENVLELNNRYYIFYSLLDGKNKIEQLFYKEIDFNTGNFIGKENLIIKVNRKITGSFTSSGFGWSFSVQDKFNFQFSGDSSKVLISYRLKPEVKDDSKNFDMIGMNVFDKDFQQVWREEVKMPYSEKKMNNIDYSIDNKGNAYILATVFEDNTTNSKKDGKPNYHIELLKKTINKPEIEKSVIRLENKFINKIWLYESPQGQMVCAGFYNKGKNPKATDGIMTCKIDNRGEVTDLNSYEIPVQVLNMYQTERTQKKNEKKEEKDKAEFEDLELRDVVFEKDGSILLVGEQYYVTSHTVCDAKGNCRTYYIYHYNDILVTKIDPMGELEWMQKLPKRQQGKAGRGGLGFKLIKRENEYVFLFLDNEKNLNLPINQIPARHQDGAGGFLTAYKVSKNEGSVSKVSIANFKEVKLIKDAKKGQPVYQFSTNRILPLSPNKFAFEVYKKKKQDILIKVDL